MTWDGRIRADARQLPLASESVQVVVTSPPYWKLRKYDVEGPQIGQEPTIEAYLDSIRAVFAEVWRVLRPDGTLWVNMGDSYANGTNDPVSFRRDRAEINPVGRRPSSGLKPKDLIGMPWRVAFALQEQGWYLRQEIIWHKTQAMPESVKDRPTRAHEQLFLLSKSLKYYYDAEAIKEPASPDTHARYARGRSKTHKYADGGPGGQTIARTFRHMGMNHERVPGVNPKAAEAGSGIRNNVSFSAAVKDVVEMANKRSVWSFETAGYPEAHYACFPPNLVEPCIRAGSRVGDICLDPFFGSGTVGMVAEQLGRRWIGIDLGYQDLQKKRLENVQKEIFV